MMTLRTLKLLDLQFVDLSKLKSYYGVVFFFLLNILSNIKALQYSNVETVIVFRTCTTLAIAYCDYRFLRLSKPSMEVVFSIVTIVLGAIIYLLMDSQLKVESIFWATLYFVIQCCEVLYVKYITSSVPMSSWTRSFYNNLIAFPFIAIAAVALGETTPLSAAFDNGDINQGCVLMVGLSCGMGLLISWTGFVCREQVSATAFSVLGNVNKILTVAINCMIWDKHSSASGIAGLLLSLLGGGLYSHFASRAPSK
jgi:drug/metabolite transporter (DMT)-like permease